MLHHFVLQMKKVLEAANNLDVYVHAFNSNSIWAPVFISYTCLLQATHSQFPTDPDRGIHERY